MLDEHDHFTVLTEWGSQKFFDVHGRSWTFTGLLTVPPEKTSDCDLLQMTRRRRLRGCGRSAKQWHPLPLCARLQYFCVNANGRCKRSRGSCPGFPWGSDFSYGQVGGVAADSVQSPWELRAMRGELKATHMLMARRSRRKALARSGLCCSSRACSKVTTS